MGGDRKGREKIKEVKIKYHIAVSHNIGCEQYILVKWCSLAWPVVTKMLSWRGEEEKEGRKK